MESEIFFEQTGETNDKIIRVVTFRLENEEYYEIFPEGMNLSGYISKIRFSSPIVDFKNNKQMRLDLITRWFIPETPYWSIHLNDEKGIVLGNIKRFGRLEEPFEDYSKNKLGRWQEFALEYHRKALTKIEDLFYHQQALDKNFFSFIRE